MKTCIQRRYSIIYFVMNNVTSLAADFRMLFGSFFRDFYLIVGFKFRGTFSANLLSVFCLISELQEDSKTKVNMSAESIHTQVYKIFINSEMEILHPG